MQLELGLAEKQRSSLLMLPTMVDVLPQGQEHGEYYSIDSGGTNIRLLYTRLGKEKHTVVRLRRARALAWLAMATNPVLEPRQAAKPMLA